MHIPELKHKHTHVNTKYIHIYHKKKQPPKPKAKPKHYIHSRNDPTGHQLGGSGGYNALVEDFQKTPNLVYVKNRNVHRVKDDNTEKVYRGNRQQEDEDDYHQHSNDDFGDIHIPKFSNDFKPSHGHPSDSGEQYHSSIKVEESHEDDDYDLTNDHNMPWGFIQPKSIPMTSERQISNYYNFQPMKPHKYNTNIGKRYTSVSIDRISPHPKEPESHAVTHFGSFVL